MDCIGQPRRFENRREIIGWWESRRAQFNLVILGVGVVSMILSITAGSLAVQPGDDFVEPFMLVIGPAVYAVAANVCYTFGWIVDTVWYQGSPRKALFKAGMIFSICLTALPGAWAVIAAIVATVSGKKLD